MMENFFDLVQGFDVYWLMLFNDFGNPDVDDFFWYATKTITYIPLFLVLAYCMHHWYCSRHVILALVLLALLITVADQTASGLCKPYFQRLRPTHEFYLQMFIHPIHGYRGGLYGFFSSHAANTFAAATFLSLFFRSRYITATLFPWAMLSSFSRMYLGVHYPTDILVGAAFGMFVGWLFYRLYDFICNSALFSRTLPDEPLHPTYGILVPTMYVITLVVLVLFVLIKNLIIAAGQLGYI